MEYKGRLLKSDSTIERISVESITPKVFFDQYVATRTPVVFTNLIPGFNPSDWTLSELKQRSGKQSVKVEHKSPSGGFGSGLPRETMSFSDFLDAVEKKDGENLYLTTQYGEKDEEVDLDDGIQYQMLHEYCPPPLPPMMSRFPRQPELLGHLIPQQVNLWIGNSSHGTSSGLHHDFHDNLYLLLQGSKRFTLFSPADAYNLYTHGKIKKVHPNGLVNYANREATREDGASEADLAQHKIDKLEDILEGLDDNDTQAREEIETELAKAQESLLDLAGPDDDFDKLFADGDMDDFDEDFEESEEEVKPKGKKAKNAEKKAKNGKSGKGKKKEEEIVSDEEMEESEPSEVEEPNSFSQISVKELHNPTKATFKNFPLLKKAQRVTVTLKVGEMLFLPTGWFHEVTSFNDSLSDNEHAKSAHVAFNYWMHPPATGATFEKPYEDEFWLEQWNQMVELIDDIDEAVRSGKRPKAIEEELELVDYVPKSKRKKNTEN